MRRFTDGKMKKAQELLGAMFQTSGGDPPHFSFHQMHEQCGELLQLPKLAYSTMAITRCTPFYMRCWASLPSSTGQGGRIAEEIKTCL